MDSLDLTKGFNGMCLIGSFVSEPEKNISAMPFLLAGDMDDQIYRGFYLTEYGTNKPYQPNDPKITLHVERLKSLVRGFVQGVFDAAAREDERERMAKMENLRAELAQSNKPHVLGTVAEIAAKFNISKSEVRRRKAEGTLEELLTQKV
jgi:hypothetical protein